LRRKTMIVTILGRSKWEWGPGDVVVIKVDDRYFAQCEESEDHDEADEVEPTTAMGLLTGRHVKLSAAGRVWMKEERELRTRFQTTQRRKTA
jgi:hypothetical protein